jgi:hypothetical protein
MAQWSNITTESVLNYKKKLDLPNLIKPHPAVIPDETSESKKSFVYCNARWLLLALVVDGRDWIVAVFDVIVVGWLDRVVDL